MAFQNKNLSVIAYANGFTLWHYASTDEAIAAISASGYFDGVKTLMNTGDIVIINASDKTAIKSVKVAGNTVTVVTVD